MIERHTFPDAPADELEKAKLLRSRIEFEGGVIFHDYNFIRQELNPDYDPNEADFENPNSDPYRKLEHPIRNLRLSIMSKEEYDRLFRSKYNQAVSDDDWGETIARFNSDMALGQGETSVVLEGPSETELALLQELYEEWREEMSKFGNKALFGDFISGSTLLHPRKDGDDSWTIIIKKGSDTVYEHEYPDGFDSVKITE